MELIAEETTMADIDDPKATFEQWWQQYATLMRRRIQLNSQSSRRTSSGRLTNADGVTSHGESAPALFLGG